MAPHKFSDSEKSFFIELSPNPVVVTDCELALLYRNPACHLHFPDLEVLGEKHPILQGLQVIGQQLEQKSGGEMISFYREVELGEKFFEEQIFALAEQNKVYMYLVDITERKKGEAELKKNELNLRNTNLRLGELLMVKDKFIATVTHELRTPLAVIKETVGIFQDGVLGELSNEQKEFMVVVEKNVQRLSALINSILDLAKYRAGEILLNRQKVDLPSLLDEVLIEVKPLLEKRKVTITGIARLFVLGDAAKIKQVFINLLANAIKFTSSDERIDFRLWTEKAVGLVAIKDNGVGIDSKDLPHLFMEFSQVGEYKAGGTGLGLCLCKNIIEQHGGTISVESELGSGTQFTFTLPIYSPKKLLEVCTQDFQKHLSKSSVGAKDVSPLLVTLSVFNFEKMGGGAKDFSPIMENLVEFLRPQIKNGDKIVALDDHFLAILAITCKNSVHDLNVRIGQIILEWWGGMVGANNYSPLVRAKDVSPLLAIGVGNAFSGLDGDDFENLLSCAKERAQYAHVFKVSQKTILLADDEPSVATVIRKRIEQLGFNVLVATDGAQALKVLQSIHPPHLVLLDIKMPKMDGLEMVRAAKTLGLTSNIPIIGFTAYGEEYKKKCDELGIDLLYKQSYSFAEMEEKIYKALEKSEA